MIGCRLRATVLLQGLGLGPLVLQSAGPPALVPWSPAPLRSSDPFCSLLWFSGRLPSLGPLLPWSSSLLVRVFLGLGSSGSMVPGVPRMLNSAADQVLSNLQLWGGEAARPLYVHIMLSQSCCMLIPNCCQPEKLQRAAALLVPRLILDATLMASLQTCCLLKSCINQVLPTADYGASACRNAQLQARSRNRCDGASTICCKRHHAFADPLHTEACLVVCVTVPVNR